MLGELGLTVIPFDEDLALRTGLLRPATSDYGLSLGDRACLALGQHLHRPVLTADRMWKTVKLGVDIQRSGKITIFTQIVETSEQPRRPLEIDRLSVWLSNTKRLTKSLLLSQR